MIPLTQNNVEDLDKLKEVVNEVSEMEPNEFAELFQNIILPKLMAVGTKIVWLLVLIFIGSKLIKFARKILRRSLEKANAETGLVQFLDSFAKISLYGLLIIYAFGSVAGSTGSLAAILASAGVAIGFALQGSLSNFAGGVLILLLRPFVVGDYIIEDTNKNEGTVKEIQMFYTKLVTADNKIIVIPNGVLSNSSLTNVTDQGKRRIDLFIGIGYQADLKLAKKVIMDILNQEQEILKEQEIQVFVHDLEDSAVKLGLRAWVKTDSFVTTKWKLLEDIKTAFDEHGIEIPYNQLDVSIKP